MHIYICMYIVLIYSPIYNVCVCVCVCVYTELQCYALETNTTL